MFRRAKATTTAPPTADGEVRIQKVDKIEVVYKNILSKPKLYKPTAATGKHPTAGHEVAGWKKKVVDQNPSRPRSAVHVDDINKLSERYITEMKKRFLG
ncbi:hypothetical protein Zm00014a_020142 [Zea mays]|uniref:Uncharacterized protein n=1 Tax=Zea mays TaxID=4577 RepID=A0A3L6GEL3_MAIZE|nr:hypothetical protein Zm00014a_020142 [Zea mays]